VHVVLDSGFRRQWPYYMLHGPMSSPSPFSTVHTLTPDPLYRSWEVGRSPSSSPSSIRRTLENAGRKGSVNQEANPQQTP
jgi:hypothetical protein